MRKVLLFFFVFYTYSFSYHQLLLQWVSLTFWYVLLYLWILFYWVGKDDHWCQHAWQCWDQDYCVSNEVSLTVCQELWLLLVCLCAAHQVNHDTRRKLIEQTVTSEYECTRFGLCSHNVWNEVNSCWKHHGLGTTNENCQDVNYPVCAFINQKHRTQRNAANDCTNEQSLFPAKNFIKFIQIPTGNDRRQVNDQWDQSHCERHLSIIFSSKFDDTLQIKWQEGTKHIDVQSDAHVADTKEVKFGHFEPVLDCLSLDQSFTCVNCLSVFVLWELSGRVETISVDFFSLCNFLLEWFGFLVAGFGKGDFLDINEEEDAGNKPNGCNNIWNDSVLPDSVRHEFKDDDAHPQNNKIGYESKGISEIVEFILNRENNTLLLREQVSEGTRLMWLICKAAHPILKSPGKMV